MRLQKLPDITYTNMMEYWVPVLGIRISYTLLVGDQCEGAPDVMRAGILRGGCLFSRSLSPTLLFQLVLGRYATLRRSFPWLRLRSDGN